MNHSKLQPLGWSNYFIQQLTLDDIEACDVDACVMRITAIHRNRIAAIGEMGPQDLLCPERFQPVSQFLAVGDWVLAKKAHEHLMIDKIIPPKNRIERLAGSVNQVIAANLDYLWIVTSANEEFNIKRLQRYLTLAYEFDIEPVVVLTKTDLCEDIYQYLDQIKLLKVQLVHAINASDMASLTGLNGYFKVGNTIALVGSSGVGKSTLINSIANVGQSTQGIRQDDDKGKHTTTHRQLFYCTNQVAIIDTPGMRELQLIHTEQGVEKTFSEVVELAKTCRFANCTHANEPGCAIQAALASGQLMADHFQNYKKIVREEEFLKRRQLGVHAEKQHERDFFKMVKTMKRDRWGKGK